MGPDSAAWEAFLRALYGLPMPPSQANVVRACTGLTAPRTTPAREAWLVVGRRGGKSRIAALAAVYHACFRDYRAVLARGEVGTLPIVAADRLQARTVMGYVTGLLERVPMLRQLIVHQTAEAITLSTGCRIEIHTASFRALRGYTIVNALRPAMATVPGALLLGISSPYARRGVLWEQYRRHYGKPGDVLVWQAPSRTMHPTLPASIVAQALEEDEAAARSEYLAEFRRDLEGYVSREALAGCTVPGRVVLPPQAGVDYVAFVDPSGGSHDSMSLAIAHPEAGIVLDCVVECRPPFNPTAVVQQFAGVLRGYRVTQVTGDRYGGEWPREQFAGQGITYVPSAQAKSELYGGFLPLLNSGRVELLDLPRLQTQLLGLERRTARGGRDAIDHAPGGHDDVANAVAGACLVAGQEREPGLLAWMREEVAKVRLGMRERTQ